MTDKAISPLRRRLIEDMTIRRLSPKPQYQLSTDVQKWTLFDIENWTPELSGAAPRFCRGGLSR